MYQHEITLRVRYAETDQMGYVYYGNYAQYFEMGRVEMLRSLGVSYKSMEEKGVMLPVLEYSSRYIKPARYDEELKLITRLPELPKARIRFEYELFNEQDELLNKAETTLVFIDKASQRPCRPPEDLIEKIKAARDK